MSATSATAFPRRSPPTVLVIDANVITRCQISDALRIHGFKVLEASSGQDAITLLNTLRIDLLLLDLDLSGSPSGEDVARHVQDSGMPIQIVLTSGAAESSDRGNGEMLGELSNPYETQQLTRLVMQMLKWPAPPPA